MLGRWSLKLSKLMAILYLLHIAVIVGLLKHPVEYLIVSDFLSMMGWLGITQLIAKLYDGDRLPAVVVSLFWLTEMLMNGAAIASTNSPYAK